MSSNYSECCMLGTTFPLFVPTLGYPVSAQYLSISPSLSSVHADRWTSEPLWPSTLHAHQALKLHVFIFGWTWCEPCQSISTCLHVFACLRTVLVPVNLGIARKHLRSICTVIMERDDCRAHAADSVYISLASSCMFKCDQKFKRVFYSSPSLAVEMNVFGLPTLQKEKSFNEVTFLTNQVFVSFGVLWCGGK